MRNGHLEAILKASRQTGLILKGPSRGRESQDSGKQQWLVDMIKLLRFDFFLHVLHGMTFMFLWALFVEIKK
jgi:hypothetical protein